MRIPALASIVLALALGLSGMPAAIADGPAAGEIPAWVVTAMQDPERGEDAKNDDRRQMAAILAFSGAKPGATVAEIAPGGGYWTRAFSQVVGEGGQVYTIWPKELLRAYGTRGLARWAGISAERHYDNVIDIMQPARTLALPSRADVVFTALNYHDYHGATLGTDMAAFNRSVLGQLKPGGVYIIIDHAAAEGSGTSAVETLHRIDPATVKAEVVAAGFTFDGESRVLRNPDDPRTAKVFDPSIRGRTDQFVYRFRK